MTEIYKEEDNKKEKLDNICEECKKEDESVSQNLMMLDAKIAIPVKYQKLFFQFNTPETRGGILELQLGYRPGSTIQEQS